MYVAPICQKERQMKERQHEGELKEKVRTTFWRKMVCALLCYQLSKDYKRLMHICLHLQLHRHTRTQAHTQTQLWISWAPFPCSRSVKTHRGTEMCGLQYKSRSKPYTHTHTQKSVVEWCEGYIQWVTKFLLRQTCPFWFNCALMIKLISFWLIYLYVFSDGRNWQLIVNTDQCVFIHFQRLASNVSNAKLLLNTNSINIKRWFVFSFRYVQMINHTAYMV